MTTAVDIHPEDLIDKLVDGELTDLEQDRLRAHLEQCSSCRFEIAVRGDLVAEPSRGARPQLTFAAPPAAQPIALLSAPPGPARPRALITLRPRSRRRWALVLVAAAFVLFAGAATAAVVSGTIKVRLLPWSPQAKSSLALGLTDALDTKHAAPEPAPAIPAAPAVSAPAEAPVASAALAPAPSSVELVSPRRANVRVASARALAPAASAVAASAAAASAARPSPEVAAASHPAPEASAETDAAPRADAAAMFAEANRARRDGNGERAVQLYRALQARYPSAAESELSRALLAQMLLERGNAEGALAGFDRYLAQDSPALSAEALVGRARALEQLAKREQAVAAWKQVQNRFPGSVHARLAAARLAALDMR
jgi:TolA-binding protein